MSSPSASPRVATAAADRKEVRQLINQLDVLAELARHIRLGRYTEEQLRLLNGYYPRGEPTPGEWIKIVK